jgi:hypothetical protein
MKFDQLAIIFYTSIGWIKTTLDFGQVLAGTLSTKINKAMFWLKPAPLLKWRLPRFYPPLLLISDLSLRIELQKPQNRKLV